MTNTSRKVWRAASSDESLALRSMALIVKKKDGTPRVVIDYRALNEVTVKNKYPLPLMDELFDRMQGARFFTQDRPAQRLPPDPHSGRRTARRRRSARASAASSTLVLPMGLCNAPGTFMQLMNDTFGDMLDKSVLVLPRRHPHLQPHGEEHSSTCAWC